MTYINIKNASNKQVSGNITFNDLVSKRFYHKVKGHTNLKVYDYDINGLLSVVGGRGDYRQLIMDYISHGKSYGILERLIFNGKRWSYCAGQDYTVEMNTIRKILRKG